jgi:DNA-binding transcriptional regulator YhcF (GntR family)
MNQTYSQEFINKALKAGYPQEKIAAVLHRAGVISERNTKLASVKQNLIGTLLDYSGMQKSASSVSYVEGLLKEAFDNGANLAQAAEFTKQALDATCERVTFMNKVSSIANDAELSKYAEGFLMQAKQAGIADDQALSLLVDLVDNVKQANDEGMFKQPNDPAVPSAPDSDPSAGAPPGMGAGGDQEAQILQMLQSLPPEEQQQIIQQLLATISGGQGGGPGGPTGTAPATGPQGPA